MEFADVTIECNASRGEYDMYGSIPALDLAFRQTVTVKDYELYPSEDSDLYSPGHDEYTEITRSTETMEVWSDSTGEPVLPLYNDKIERALITEGHEEEFYRAIESELTNYHTPAAYYV